MNKKGGWIISILLIIIGGIMIALGTFYGGWKDVRSIANNSALAQSIHLNFGWSGKKDALSINDASSSFAASEVEELDIDINSASIAFEYATDGKISVAAKEVGDFKCELKGHTLVFKCDDKKHINGVVTFFIPEGTEFDEIKLDAGAGNLDVEEFLCDKLVLNIGAGESTIKKLIVKKDAKIDIGAGNVDIEDASIEDLKLDVGMGNCDFTGVVTDSLDANCGLGNITFTMNDSAKNHNYKVSSDVGNITIDGDAISGFGSKERIDNDVDSDYEMSCGMGNIDLTFSK